MTPGPQDNAEREGEPVVRDKRRIDPETGELREHEPSPAVEQEPETGSEEAGQVDQLGELTDQLARAKADNYNLDQRFNAYVRRSRGEVAEARTRGHAEVVEALIGVLDDIDLARQHGELSGPFASIAEKLEGVLQGSFAVERYGQAGDEFDPEVHEALMHNESEDVTTEQVQQVLQPGYKMHDRVIRPARVAVVGPQ